MFEGIKYAKKTIQVLEMEYLIGNIMKLEIFLLME